MDFAIARKGELMSTTANGGPSENAQSQFTVLAQYIKDFSFENPNAPQSLTPLQQAPQIGVQINVSAKPLSDTDFEVTLKIDGKAENNGSLLFNLELEFAGIFRLRNIPRETLNMMMLIECPRILFPFAREIVATTVRNGGFPPLLLEPVDFVALYRQRLAQIQQPNAMPA
jgi:preprotein translocase subunit SecB